MRSPPAVRRFLRLSPPFLAAVSASCEPSGAHRDGTLRDAPGTLGVCRASPPGKLYQWLGDLDRQQDPPTATPLRSESSFGVLGADLGYSFMHEGRVVFLFGDTLAARPDARRPKDADSLAYLDGA